MTANSLSQPQRRGLNIYRLRWVDRVAILAIVVGLFVVFAAPNAFAAVDQGGRYDSTFERLRERTRFDGCEGQFRLSFFRLLCFV